MEKLNKELLILDAVLLCQYGIIFSSNKSTMQFLSLQPFVPSGKNFELAKEFFQELGFNQTWNAGAYAGFENGNCRFILQEYDQKEFAENFMLTVNVPDIAAFRSGLLEKQFPQKFGIHIGEITNQPYGKEVNIIDLAGVCWHFVE